MELKSLVGTSAGPLEEDVSAERIREFCLAVGARELDEAPPTFLTLFRGTEVELFKKLEVELSRVLHAEQEFQLDRPIQAGDRLIFTTLLSRALEKRGSTGHLQFLTFETEYSALRGSERLAVGSGRTLVVIRGAA